MGKGGKGQAEQKGGELRMLALVVLSQQLCSHIQRAFERLRHLQAEKFVDLREKGRLTESATAK